MKQEKIYAAIGLIVLLAGISGTFVAGYLLFNTSTIRKLSAWEMGAVYLGNNGVVMQVTNNDCGPCSLKMIFDYYKIPSSVEEIEHNLSSSKKGTSMLGLKKLAELKGLKTEGWILTPEDILKEPFPSLLFVQGNHFIIADSIKNNKIFIRDPAIGRLKFEKKELLKIWHGETLVFLKY